MFSSRKKWKPGFSYSARVWTAHRWRFFYNSVTFLVICRISLKDSRWNSRIQASFHGKQGICTKSAQLAWTYSEIRTEDSYNNDLIFRCYLVDVSRGYSLVAAVAAECPEITCLKRSLVNPVISSRELACLTGTWGVLQWFWCDQTAAHAIEFVCMEIGSAVFDPVKFSPNVIHMIKP